MIGDFAIRLLGPVEVRDGDRAISVGGAKAKAVLAVLATDAGRPVPMDVLIDQLWRDDPPNAAVNTVHVYIAAIRKALAEVGKSVSIETIGGGYVLHARGQIDVDAFTLCANRARSAVRSGDLEAGAREYRDALGLWRGPALFGLRDFDRLDAIARGLDEQELEVFEAFVRNEATLGRGTVALPLIEARAIRHPTRESMWSLYVTELYRAGRQVDALEALRAVRDSLMEDLGVDLGSELRELQVRVLQQDPSLTPRAPMTFEDEPPARTMTTPAFDGPCLVDAQGQIRRLPPVAVIGRDRSCDVVLVSPHVSARHARIVADGDDSLVEDLGSKNGTSVNGVPTSKHALRSGDSIDFAGVKLRFEASVPAPRYAT